MVYRTLIVSVIAVLVGCGSDAPIKGGPYFGDDIAVGDGDGDGPSEDDHGDAGDSSGDAIGDAGGDSAPTDNDPPTTLGTIRDVKTGVIAIGGQVRLENVIVTAVGGNGVFVSTAGSSATEYDGLYLYDPPALGELGVGDIINVDTSLVQLFSGQIQLAQPVTQLMTPSSGVPAALVVLPTDITPTGGKHIVLEGMLVRVENVEVISTNLGGGEFIVTGSLTVDPFLYPVGAPAIGTHYDSITGILRAFGGDTKLTPRNAGDLVEGS